MRGARDAPAPRDSLNFRRASLLSRNEFERATFTIVLHATSSFTYVSVIYGANFSFKMHANFCRRNGTALPSLQTRFDYHTLVMFYKIHTKQAPSYLTSLLPPLSSRSGYTFRKLSYRFPTVSRTSTLNSFLPRAVALWNALPTNVQQRSSIYTFKKLLQSHLKI